MIRMSMMAHGLATILTLMASLAGCGGGGAGFGTCRQGGKTYQVGTTFKDSDGCNTCECRTDGIACTEMACLWDSGLPQADAPAPPPEGPSGPVTPTCTYNGQMYPAGATFPSTDGCNTCECLLQEVACTLKACPGVAGTSGVDGGSDTPQPVGDSDGAIDGAGQSTGRDPTRVQSVRLTAAQVFMQPTAPFLLRADLARGPDGLFALTANLQVSVSGCTGDACTRQVTMRLSREQTARIEGWVAVVPGEACHDDPGPICDFGARYAIGIDGPPQNQTCCKLNEWGQNGDVTALHSYLQDLVVAQLNPAQANPG
jgi:hypothetical protein